MIQFAFVIISSMNSKGQVDGEPGGVVFCRKKRKGSGFGKERTKVKNRNWNMQECEGRNVPPRFLEEYIVIFRMVCILDAFQSHCSINIWNP